VEKKILRWPVVGANDECLSFLDLSGGPATNVPEMSRLITKLLDLLKFGYMPERSAIDFIPRRDREKLRKIVFDRVCTGKRLEKFGGKMVCPNISQLRTERQVAAVHS
jgi:hypothetical protein